MISFTYMEVKQGFKAIYFPDLRNDDTKSKSLTLAFSESEKDIYSRVRHLSSHSLRKIIECNTYQQLEENAKTEGLPVNRYCLWKLKKAVGSPNNIEKFDLNPIHTTFQGHKDFPLQSWYPYLEGYSPDFVDYIIDHFVPNNAKVIYDPFSGTGTTPLTATGRGYQAYYSEVNPLLQFLTKVKSKARNIENRKKLINTLRNKLDTLEKDIEEKIEDPELISSYNNSFGESQFFKPEVFTKILKTRTFLNEIYFENVLVSEILTVATLSSLVENSLLKRQGDLRFRKGKELEELEKADYYTSIIARVENIIRDLEAIKPAEAPVLITEDARTIGKLPQLGIDAVITSPPYLNGTNYFRNTKVELWFLGYLKNPSNLSNFRRMAVTAGINDVALKIPKQIDNAELRDLIFELEAKAYDKRIPKMVNDYFADMYTIFSNLKTQLNKGAVLAIDLGDSIYSGIHVKTDEILISVLENIGYTFEKEVILRRRQSNNGQELKQVLLIFKNPKQEKKVRKEKNSWEKNWESFKQNMPHQSGVMAKRNWGDPIHSLCSYQGKLKPSIAHQLVKTFVPENGLMLDIFGGVGTIPLEAALQNKKSISFDISPTALAISRAKLEKASRKKVFEIISEIEKNIKNKVDPQLHKEISDFGMNKTLKDYFHPDTLNEIINARLYFEKNGFDTPEKALVLSSIMHILHGNRPYALSRRSHGITPFAPKGDFEYKYLIEKLKEKVNRTLLKLEREQFCEGETHYQDVTKTWPAHIQNIDTIITSPPFFDSTRFYAANWMRLWFAGWDTKSFKTEPVNFIDELQKKDFSVYDNVFMQARERLKKDGVFVLHLGKSSRCDMAKVLAERASKWFNVHDIFEESVENGESHGIRDRGSTTQHQYLILN